MEKNEVISDAEIKRILTNVIERFLIPKFYTLGLEASGNWRAQLEVRKSSIFGTKYTEQLVYGRQPGTFAPIQPLKEWAKIKLGLDDRQALGAAFAISKTLKEKGSLIYQNGGSDLLEVLNSNQVLDYINTEIGNYISQQTVINIRNYVQQKLR